MEGQIQVNRIRILFGAEQPFGSDKTNPMEFRIVEEAISQLKQTGGTVHEVLCQDPSQPENLEKKLGMELPASVRAFYSRYEYLQVGPYEFIWARNLPDLVERLRHQFEIPESYLPVLSDGMGGYYYVGCSEETASHPENFGKVVHRPTGTANTVEIRCGEFFEFVLSRITIANDES